MTAFTIHSDVVKGRIETRAALHLSNCLAAFEGKRVTLTLRLFAKTRSSKQNRFMHGPFFKAWRAVLMNHGIVLSPTQAKELFKRMFGPTETITLPNGEVQEILKSTAEYTTLECEDSMEKARVYAAIHFGEELPFPNEERALETL